jgi:hypothetical protein
MSVEVIVYFVSLKDNIWAITVLTTCVSFMEFGIYSLKFTARCLREESIVGDIDLIAWLR